MIRKKRVPKKDPVSSESLHHLKKKSTRAQRAENKDNAATNDVTKRMGNLSVGTEPAELCKFSTRSSSVAVLSLPGNNDQAFVYARNVRLHQRCFKLSLDGCYAFPDWSEKEKHLLRNFVLVEVKRFCTEDEGECRVIYMCSCATGESNRERLGHMDNIVQDPSGLQFAEEDHYCLHSKVAKQLNLQPFEDDEDTDCVQQISTVPFLAAVHDGDRYGLLKRVGRMGKLTCQQCPYQRHSCGHIQSYNDWCRERDIEPEVALHLASESVEEFTSISYSPIPYPWPAEMKEKFERLSEPGLQQFPKHLLPDCPEGPCPHGNSWDKRDPIKQGWVSHDGVLIHLEELTISTYKDADGSEVNRVAYYRPTIGGCTCRRQYDGLDDLLHNLDNKNMYYFGFLLKYMNDMIYSRKPLKAAERSANKTRQTATTHPPLSYRLLRKAWNSWARRLAIPWNEVFRCPVCGEEPTCVVCDGTCIGFRKDFLPPATEETKDTGPRVAGSRHADRVFVKTKQARDLLLRYSGEKRGQKAGCKNGLSGGEFANLISLLDNEGHQELVEILQRLRSEGGGRIAPTSYRKLLSELAKNSPVCGIVQVGEDAEAIQLVGKLAKGAIGLVTSADSAIRLQKSAPVIFGSLRDITKGGGEIPGDVKELLLRIHSILDKMFNDVPVPPESAYPPPAAPSGLAFFPGLDQHIGLPRYEADAKSSGNPGSCRKESYGHPSLTPGIFTLFCRHGICYGFDCMTSCESPRHPYQIFRTRFRKAPNVIVYDNACKLHQYALNREPHFFRNTQFLVDRFHFRGHIGCSLGYCMDEYKQSIDITTINSQVNEQANAGLIRIQPQLSYMSPSNFVFHASLFLAIRNFDAISKLDMTS
eukprot:XP_002609506.1 hypothetical protein BRAFLDRAFT_95599 [Branchiostoma floridae]